MKNLSFILMFLFLANIFIVSALSEDRIVQESRYLTITLQLSSTVTIMPTSLSYYVDHVSVLLPFIPGDDYRQKTLSLITIPAATEENDSLKFLWKNPEKTNLSFAFNSQIETSSNYLEIRKKADFPIKALPEDVLVYTKPSTKIDSGDPDIISLASGLAEGETDLYVVVYKTASWVTKNIKYDLSTLTADVSQNASWVLKNREGVCDELSVLLIAMLRSLGIPARFVSGISYTNSPLFKERWGFHGWTEVYFPEYGWVPFDPTYGQYGYIDAGHMKLNAAVDPEDVSTKYESSGRNIQLEAGKLNVEASIIDYRSKNPNYVSISAKMLYDKVGYGSYNLVEAEVENLMSYYVTEAFLLARTSNIQNITAREQKILLKPFEKKALYWPIKVDEDLQQGNVYFEFPMLVYSSQNISTETKFNAYPNEYAYSYDEVNSILKQKTEEEKKVYSKIVALNCSSEKEVYLGAADVDCRIKNTGNIILADLNVCVKDDCRTLNLGISEEKEILFEVVVDRVGKNTITVEANNDDVSKAAYLEIMGLDKPSLSIDDLEYPAEMKFNDIANISFLIKKNSLSNPKNAAVDYWRNKDLQKWQLGELANDQKIKIGVKGAELSKENTIKIIITYEDKEGSSYREEKEFKIRLVNLTLWQKIRMFFRDLF
ncbi:MAG: transglutaminase domain-containing protein [Candidatus Woesearchaeota archaeon]|nr:transglutaminase domain-containing protein [Candidatus Woesearchaeota archaeon]